MGAPPSVATAVSVDIHVACSTHAVFLRPLSRSLSCGRACAGQYLWFRHHNSDSVDALLLLLLLLLFAFSSSPLSAATPDEPAFKVKHSSNQPILPPQRLENRLLASIDSHVPHYRYLFSALTESSAFDDYCRSVLYQRPCPLLSCSLFGFGGSIILLLLCNKAINTRYFPPDFTNVVRQVPNFPTRLL